MRLNKLLTRIHHRFSTQPSHNIENFTPMDWFLLLTHAGSSSNFWQAARAKGLLFFSAPTLKTAKRETCPANLLFSREIDENLCDF